MDDYKIALGALLDANAKGDINKQLNAIEDLSVTISKATLSNDVINDIKRQLTQNGIDLKLVFGNVNQITTQAKQTGQQIGQQVQNGINDAIQKGNFKKEFTFSADKINKVAKDAQAHFKDLYGGVVTVTEQMEKLETGASLKSFTVNIKNAKGEVESLKYALRDIEGKTGQSFQYTGGSINDAGAIKQIKDIENAFTDYTAKLAQFKSTNTNILSGLMQPLADFESKLAGLKNGTVTIDEVKNAFKLLGTEASKITENFTGQLSKTDAAIRKLAQGDEIMDKLKASFKGLNNAPKEITKELNSVSKLLQNVKKIESTEGRTANWSAEYRKWSDEVDKLQAKLSVLQKQQANMTTPQIFKTSELKDAGVAYMTKVSNTINKQMPELQKMLNAHNWNLTDIKGIEDTDGKIKSLTLTVRDAEGALKQFVMQRAKLDTGKNTPNGLMQVGDVKILETASQAQEKLAQSTEKANAKLAEQANKIQLSYANGDYEAKVQSTIAKTQQWVNANGEARISTTSLSTALSNLDKVYLAITADGGNTVANQKALKQAESELSAEIKKVTNDVTKMNATMAKSSAVDALRQKYQMFYDTNTAAHRKWGKSLLSAISELAPGAEVSKQRIKELEQGLINTSNAARQAGKLGLSFFDTIKQGMQKFSYWTSSTFIIMKTIQEIKEAVSFAKEMDSALTNINYTMDVTKSQLTDIGNSSIQMAKDLKTSASDILGAVTLYANAKETADSILKKSEAAIMLGNVTGMSGEQSAKALQSVMNQFDMTQDDLMYISDTIQSVSQNMAYNFASGIEEIVGGIERSGSVAKAAGLDLNEYASMLGLVIEKTGLSGETIGTAYRTILTRITKASKIEGTSNEDISKAETALNAVGVQVRSTAGEFRDMTDIMEDLGKVWNNLNDVQQANISYEIAGTRQTNIIKTLLGYWTEYEDLATKAGNASGTTLENQSKYEETLDAKTKELSTTMQSFWHNLIGAEEANGALAIFQKVATALDTISGTLGSLGTIGLGAGIFAGIKNIGKTYRCTVFKIIC